MRKAIVLTVTLILVVASLGAQSLLEDPGYRELIDRIEELKTQAQTALDDGRYDDAVEYSRQAEEVAAEAEEYAEQRVLAYRAVAWTDRARQRIRYAESINAQTHYAEAWELANQHMADATASYEAEDWAEAIAASRLVVSTLEDVKPVRVTEEPEPEPEPEPQPEPEPEPEPEPQPEAEPVEPVLPKYYVVRLIPERRDCFWRIAEYDFIYGDPWQWRELYEANRDKIPDPNNPDLILPGMIVEIPAIDGEERAGTWNPVDLPPGTADPGADE